MNRLKIIENDTFIIQRNWSGYLKSFLVNGLAGFGGIYLGYLMIRNVEEVNPVLYLVFLFPVAFVFLIIKDLFKASDKFIFNEAEKTISKNGKVISSFQEIHSVQISYSTGDGATYYLFKCVKNDNSDFVIEERLRESEAIHIGKQLSLYLGKPLEKVTR